MTAALHRCDDVIELIDGRHTPVHAAEGVEEHRKGGNSQLGQRGDEQCRLVLAVAESGAHDFVGGAGLIAAESQRDGDVANVLGYPAVHGAN